MIITLHNTDKEENHTMTLEHFIKEFNDGRLPDELFIITDISEQRKFQGPKSKKYFERGGQVCPFCGSNKIEQGFVEVDKGAAYQESCCNDCSGYWEAIYKLDDILVIDDGVKSDQTK